MGTITWQYRFKFNGKYGRVSLGRYPDLRIVDARQHVPELRNAIANHIDPRIFWKQRNVISDVTVKDCCEKFLELRRGAIKHGTYKTYESCFRAHLYGAFESRKVEGITLGEWIDFFDKKAAISRVTAGAILKQLKTVLNWAVRRQIVEP